MPKWNWNAHNFNYLLQHYFGKRLWIETAAVSDIKFWLQQLYETKLKMKSVERKRNMNAYEKSEQYTYTFASESDWRSSSKIKNNAIIKISNKIRNKFRKRTKHIRDGIKCATANEKKNQSNEVYEAKARAWNAIWIRWCFIFFYSCAVVFECGAQRIHMGISHQPKRVREKRNAGGEKVRSRHQTQWPTKPSNFFKNVEF